MLIITTSVKKKERPDNMNFIRSQQEREGGSEGGRERNRESESESANESARGERGERDARGRGRDSESTGGESTHTTQIIISDTCAHTTMHTY